MFRRGIRIAPLVKPQLGVAQRSYVDLTHHKFPYIPEFLFGWVGFLTVGWVFYLSCGTVWWEANRAWKTDIYTRSWKRHLGTGYKWADEWGPQVESIYTNLPSGVKD